ncbi:MAG: LysM peptidoglycan-binding domain-containing protein [Arachnia sp.]
MRAARAAGAALALAALLVGVPWALARFGTLPDLLTLNWADALTGPAGGRLMLALLSAVGWGAWLVLAATVLLELASALSRHRLTVTLPGTGWLRPVISALVLAAVGTPGVAMADAAAQPAEAPPPPRAPAAAPAVAERESARAPDGRPYEVQPGDELWSVAERELGAGQRWRDIVDLNPTLDASSRLAPGSVILLPQVEEPPATPDTDLHVVVAKGDSLWLIAERELGDPERWPEIHRLNRDQIADPDLIDVGWVLRLPRSADRPAPEPSHGPEAVDQSPAPVDESPPADEVVPTPAPLPLPDPSPLPDPEPVPAPKPSPAPEASPARDLSAAAEAGEVDPLLLAAPLGAALAGAILISVTTRRRAQLLGRAVGRRLIPLPPRVTAFWAALARRAEETDESSAAGDEPGPTHLVLGWRDDEPVTVDLEAEGATLLHGPGAPGVVAAAITSLACAPWSDEVQVVVVGDDEWAAALDDPRIGSETDSRAGLARMTRLSAERRLALRTSSLADARADRDTAEAWQPVVFVFARPLTPAELDTLGDCLALGETGVSALALTTGPPHISARVVHVAEDAAHDAGGSFIPQHLPAPARRALLGLFEGTGRTDTETAPWWRHGSDLPPNVHPLPMEGRYREEPAMTARPDASAHPTLLLLGSVALTSAAGQAPSRAAGQCLEYCAWLLAHPGSTSTAMVRELLVAEGTRRSNMSRLRSWLGSDDDGLPYLPDAYSGRISLDPRVTSDWEQFQALLSGGVNVAPDASLRQSLSLVRGEPLGDLAVHWHWAEQLRTDMVAMIVDAASVLADRAIARDDTGLALWALDRASLAAPDDDQLAVRRAHALAAAGRVDEARQQTVALNRVLRTAGRDLPPELSRRLHRALNPPPPPPHSEQVPS